MRVLEIPSQDSSSASASEAPISASRTRRIVVNVPAEEEEQAALLTQAVPVQGLKVKGVRTIVGPHVQPLKGGIGAQIEVIEGLWEQRRGHKVDGGERRKAEVRAKKRAEARKAAR